MPVYTVHAPVTNGAGIAAVERFAFVRDGFHFWAAVFGPLWLVWHRLWLALTGWIIVALAINVGMARLGADGTAIFWVDVLIALLMGFEASSIRRWTLSRRDWRQLDIVVARNWETAERRFFDRWTARQRMINDQTAVDRGLIVDNTLPGGPAIEKAPFGRLPIAGHYDVELAPVVPRQGPAPDARRFKSHQQRN